MKLYELTSNYLTLLDMEESETVADTLASIEEAIEDKAENIAKLIKNMEADVTALKDEEKRLADKRKVIENKISNVKTYLQEQLMMANLQKVKRPTFTIAIQNNPPSVAISDENKVPSIYRIAQPDKIDKKALLQAMKDGQAFEGIEMKQSQSLRIR